MTGRAIRAGWLTVAAASLSGEAAYAQVVSPMLHDVVAQGPVATARFEAANPYEHSQKSEFFIVDDRGRRVNAAFVSPARRTLAAGARLPVLVQIPMDGQLRRTVYLCHAITPLHPNAVDRGTTYRGEVCAKINASRSASR